MTMMTTTNTNDRCEAAVGLRLAGVGLLAVRFSQLMLP